MKHYNITIERNIRGEAIVDSYEFKTHITCPRAVLVKQLMKALTGFYVNQVAMEDLPQEEAIRKIISKSQRLRDPLVLVSEARQCLHITDCAIASDLAPQDTIHLKEVAMDLGMPVSA